MTLTKEDLFYLFRRQQAVVSRSRRGKSKVTKGFETDSCTVPAKTGAANLTRRAFFYECRTG